MHRWAILTIVAFGCTCGCAFGCDSSVHIVPEVASSSSSSVASSSSSGTAASGGSGGSGAASNVGGTGGAGGSPAIPGVNCDPPGGTKPNRGPGIKLTQHIAGVPDPVLVTHAPDDNERLFIVERQGRVHVVKGGQTSVFLDIAELVFTNGKTDERGLIGLAFHPDYSANGRFFVHYSEKESEGDTRVVEYARSADPEVAAPDPVGLPYLQLEQPYQNHNGGSIEFSPIDGLLYIALGDGGAGGDPLANGQDTSTALGSLLRLDVSTNPATIPAGNLTGAGVDGRIYDHGLRNPYRFNFDACTGDRYIGDVGQGKWEEISVASAGDGNKNWGWRLTEGDHCFNPMNDCDPGAVTSPPAVEYDHGQGCSVVGGHVYRGDAIPWLRGAYLYADYCSGRIWMFRWDGGVVSDSQLLLDTDLRISCFGRDNRGELYVCSFDPNGADEFIHRIDPDSTF